MKCELCQESDLLSRCAACDECVCEKCMMDGCSICGKAVCDACSTTLTSCRECNCDICSECNMGDETRPVCEDCEDLP